MEPQSPAPSEEFNSLLAKVIHEINFKLGSGWAFEQLLDSIFDSLILLIPFDRIGIALLEDGGKSLRLKWVRSKIEVQSLKKDYSALLVGSSLKDIIDTGEPRIVNDLMSYLREHPDSKSTELIVKDGIRSSLTFPLRADNKAVGVVFFSSRYANTYNESHVEIFSSIAAELSVIVEQARLKDFFSEIESRDMAIAKVLHDLRSPVSIIQGYLELASSEEWYESLPLKIKEICGVLKKNTNSMMLLLDEVADFKRMKNFDGIGEVLRLKKVDVEEFCDEVAADGNILAQSKDIQFDFFKGENLPSTVEMDRDRIRRVLENLFSNAVKFSSRRRSIKFSVWCDHKSLFFSVEDQGQGIPSEDLSKLFKQYGTTSTRPSEGEHSSGLGLYISKAIVQQHGGDISVQTKFGTGSTFTFWIPLRSRSENFNQRSL